uniref:Putative tyrosine-protein kinase, neurotrophic receptor, type 3 n=1 Tax=Helianthus annuus TaxID=4232 RepID=A0A251TRU2_HELAN
MGDADDHQETRQQLSTEDLKVFTYDELKCVFSYKTRLGDWSFGKVYKGWVDEETYSPTEQGTGLAVFVKTFQHHHSEYIKKSKLHLVLKKLSHPNLVKLIGYCFEGDLLFLVDEFYYGNFEDCLLYGAISRLPLDTKVKMALGIARAIVFLHQTHHTTSVCSCAEQSFSFERCNILLDEVHANLL